MRHLRSVPLALALALLLAACAGFQAPGLVAPGRQSVAGGLTVETPIAWSRMPSTRGVGEIWTVNGPLLDQLRFHAGLPTGQALDVVLPGKALPTFRADMTPSEVAELVLDTLGAQGAAGVELEGLRPAAFAGSQGFRLDYTFRTAAGLRIRGTGAGAVRGGRLYLITFQAPADHYFERYRPTAERLMATAAI